MRAGVSGSLAVLAVLVCASAVSAAVRKSLRSWEPGDVRSWLEEEKLVTRSGALLFDPLEHDVGGDVLVAWSSAEPSDLALRVTLGQLAALGVPLAKQAGLLEAVRLLAAGGECDSQDAPPPPASAHQYCIIGAGPGGIQLAQYMHARDLDVVVFEREGKCGSWFSKFPAERKLISINKRFTGRTDADFNLRHDWNSLLDNPAVAPMTNRSSQYYPSADTLQSYLDDYCQELRAAGKIRLNTEVTQIRRGGGGGQQAFSLEIRGGAGGTRTESCGVLVMANGVNIPNKPPNLELAMGYEEYAALSEKQRQARFEGKSVAVFGTGIRQHA
jgi:hypothetical protein